MTKNNFTKKTFFLFVFTLICGIIFGQDIIVTKDAKKIEAKVTEVNVNDIKYKLSINPDGPIYTMPKSDLSSIIYQNGTIDLFEDTKQQTQNLSDIEKSNIAFNFLSLTDNQQEEYLKEFNTELYKKFKSGQNLSKRGKELCSVGAGLTLFCGCFMLLTNPDDSFILGAIGFTVAGVLFDVGIPLAAVGGGIKKSVQNEYQEKYLGTTNPKGQLQFQLLNNGIGLAYVF